MLSCKTLLKEVQRAPLHLRASHGGNQCRTATTHWQTATHELARMLSLCRFFLSDIFPERSWRFVCSFRRKMSNVLRKALLQHLDSKVLNFRTSGCGQTGGEHGCVTGCARTSWTGLKWSRSRCYLHQVAKTKKRSHCWTGWHQSLNLSYLPRRVRHFSVNFNVTR